MSKVNDKEDDQLDLMRERFAGATAAWSDTRESELDDLRFLAGSPDNQWQWPEDVLSTRGAVQGQSINARPTLTINKLPQHVKQVTNEQRQNRPACKVIPVDDKADIEVAEIFDGIIKHIEYKSNADIAYDTACENQVTYGEGYIRIISEYCDDNSFNQDLKIMRVRNSFSVYLDPLCQDPCGADAQWAFVTEDLTKIEFEQKFPNAQPLTAWLDQGVGDETKGYWISKDTIRVADYYFFETEEKTLNLYPNEQTAYSDSPEAKYYKEQGIEPTKTRKVMIKTLKYWKTNGYEILEENIWPGKHIPIIRVLGNEFEVNGKILLSGIIRNAKDPQRMYNYWASCETEMLALSPKAPFIGYAGQFQGFEQQWGSANTTNWPYLQVNPDATDGAGNPLPLPQRAQPPLPQTGILQAKLGAADDIKAVTGQYDSSLGATSNERSGRAILAREKQGDTGTYHFQDNHARGIREVAWQLVDLIPKYYDVPRIARIIGVDGDVGMAYLNPQQQEPVRKIKDVTGNVIQKIYNPTVGTYDVCVTTGPSYMTKRQEAMDAMMQILQGNPELWKVAGDLFVKNMDWPGAQELSERLAKTIDPKLLEDNDKSPALQAAEQQIQGMAQEMEQMHQMLQQVQQSMEAQDLQIKAYNAETNRIKVVQASMSPEQIQDIVLGTLHAAISTGDVTGIFPQPQIEDSQMPQTGIFPEPQTEDSQTPQTGIFPQPQIEDSQMPQNSNL